MIVSVGRKEAWANSVERVRVRENILKIFWINDRKKTNVVFCLGSSSNTFSATCSPAAISENLTFLLKGSFLSEHLSRLLVKLSGIYLLTFTL